jgi:Zn-dependent M32 family carboxypeptidase
MMMNNGEIGVALSAITEINFEFVGFLAALISAIANVGHAMYTKGVLRSSNCGPLILHMYTSIASTLILLP